MAAKGLNRPSSIRAFSSPKLALAPTFFSCSYSWFAAMKCRSARINAGSFAANAGLSLPSVAVIPGRKSLQMLVGAFSNAGCYSYESGKPVRWKIARQDGETFGLAGIWERRQREDGTVQTSFSMLTINATDHPLMQRFHRADAENRSVVVLADDNWQTWLAARAENDVVRFLRPFAPDLMIAGPAPR